MEDKFCFNPGQIICIDDAKYIVIRNYGKAGLVKEHKKDGILINNMSWLNKKISECDEKVPDEILSKLIKEFESFF